jgi:hypothetical protein
LAIETVEIHLMQDCWIGWVSGESVVPEGGFERLDAAVWVVGLLIIEDSFGFREFSFKRRVGIEIIDAFLE